MVTEIKKMRLAAGLSQSEVCNRTGIARPNLSAYESGRRDPSEETVARIRHACRRRPSETVKANRDTIRDIVKKHHGLSVAVFGSAARGDDRWDSDIDLLVKFDDEAGMLDMVRMSRDLEKVLGVSVDVVDADVLDESSSRFDKRVMTEAVTL